MGMQQQLINYGALGIMVVVLLYAVKALYARNTTMADKFAEIITNNTVALLELKEMIKTIKNNGKVE